MGEHNGTKTELYRTNAKSHGLVPAYFALIIIIVVHVVKHQSVLINTCRRQESLRMMQGSSISINKYMQKAGEPEDDAGFPKYVYSQLNCSCYSYLSKPRFQWVQFLGCTSMVSLSGC